MNLFSFTNCITFIYYLWEISSVGMCEWKKKMVSETIYVNYENNPHRYRNYLWHLCVNLRGGALVMLEIWSADWNSLKSFLERKKERKKESERANKKD